MADTPQKPTPPRVKVARPDELTRETFEFIAAIDEFKRNNMISIVSLEDLLTISHSLGYSRHKAGSGELELQQLQNEIDKYKKEKGRLFPNWSEIFGIMIDMGYTHRDQVA